MGQTGEPLTAIIIGRRGDTGSINVDKRLDDISNVRFVIVFVTEI